MQAPAGSHPAAQQAVEPVARRQQSVTLSPPPPLPRLPPQRGPDATPNARPNPSQTNPAPPTPPQKVVVDSTDVGMRLVSELNRQRSGRVTFMPLDALRVQEVRAAGRGRGAGGAVVRSP